MFAHDTFTAIFGAVRPGELEVLGGLIRAALREDYAVVLNEPGTKKPLCPYTARQRKDADQIAQDEAHERGEQNASARRHACGIGHALQGPEDAKKVTALLTRLTKAYGGTPNVGLEPGRSRLLVVDMDTAGQRDAFLAAWEREAPGTAPAPEHLYTVASPGQRGPDGEWAHSDGGHAWFTLPPGVSLPTAHDAGRGVLTDDGGWSLIWSGLQVLVPPSVREEGPYRLVNGPRPAPAWLLQRVETEVLLREEREALRLERRAERVRDGDIDPVDAWSAEKSWAELLEPRGWSATGRVDTCSCPTWTAPGPHGSPKSATAHDHGCAIYDTDDGHAPLHVWTDSPPDYLVDALRAGKRTLTKLTHEAYADHEGSESAAVIALGLAVGEAGPMVVDNPFDLPNPQPVHELSTGPSSNEEGPGPGPSAMGPGTGPDDFSTPSDLSGGEDPGLAKVVSEPIKPVKDVESFQHLTVLTSRQLRARPRPQPLVHGLLDRGTVALLSGKFGTYKSFLAMDIALHVALGRPWSGHDVDQAVPVVYIAAEGETGMQDRVWGWERQHHDDQPVDDDQFAIIPHRVVLEVDKAGKAKPQLKELVELVTRRKAGLVVFDTLSKSRAQGSEENSNSDMSALMSLVIELCRATGATVLLVAHTGYSGEHVRGGSSQEDDADASFVIKFEDPKSEDRSPDNRRVLHHRKAKDGVLSPPRVLTPQVVVLGTDDHGRVIDTLTLSTDPWVEPRPVMEVTRAERAGREAEFVTLILEVWERAGKRLGRPATWASLAPDERPQSDSVGVFKRAHADASIRWPVRQDQKE